MWWMQAAWATCTAGSPCEVARVDADCVPVDGPARAGQPMFLRASCIDSVCCAGSAESCSTAYRPFEPEVWRQDGEMWVLTGLKVEPAGTCGDTPRYVLTPPGGTLRLETWTVQVAGELPQIPTPWPPGFPTLADGLHQRVPSPSGEAEVGVAAADLEAAMREAGWVGGPSQTWALREGVLVRFDGRELAWSTHEIPTGSWWTAEAPCPAGSRLVERPLGGAIEHACLGPGDVLVGPYTTVFHQYGARGWYADGEPDGDWLTLSEAGFEIQSYERGEPTGAWKSLQRGLIDEGRYADGGKDGTWTTTTRGPEGFVQTDIVEWCRGVRCGAYRRVTGPRVTTGSYVDDLRHGPWYTMYEGLLLFEGSYDRDRPVGVHREFQGNGQLLSVSVWDEQGRQDGVWLEYDSYGRIVRRDLYRDGVLRRSREWVENEWGSLRGRRARQLL